MCCAVLALQGDYQMLVLPSLEFVSKSERIGQGDLSAAVQENHRIRNLAQSRKLVYAALWRIIGHCEISQEKVAFVRLQQHL